jgi:hypothetical protein
VEFSCRKLPLPYALPIVKTATATAIQAPTETLSDVSPYPRAGIDLQVSIAIARAHVVCFARPLRQLRTAENGWISDSQLSTIKTR